jgi:hypothetical protein
MISVNKLLALVDGSHPQQRYHAIAYGIGGPSFVIKYLGTN